MNTAQPIVQLLLLKINQLKKRHYKKTKKEDGKFNDIVCLTINVFSVFSFLDKQLEATTIVSYYCDLALATRLMH
jgi:hypothetical protein